MIAKITNVEQKNIISSKGKERRLIIFKCNDTDGKEIETLEFGNPHHDFVHSKSRLYKIMKKFDCKYLNQMIGKMIDLKFNEKINKWKIVI